MRIYRIIIALALGVILLSGCHSDREGIAARYELERKLWHATSMERAMRRSGSATLEQVIERYEEIISYESIREQSDSTWSDIVRRDIADLVRSGSQRLAELYFLRDSWILPVYAADREFSDCLVLFPERSMLKDLARSIYFPGPCVDMASHVHAVAKAYGSEMTASGDTPRLRSSFLEIPDRAARIAEFLGMDRQAEICFRDIEMLHRITMRETSAPDQLEGMRMRYVRALARRCDFKRATEEIDAAVWMAEGSTKAKLLLEKANLKLDCERDMAGAERSLERALAATRVERLKNEAAFLRARIVLAAARKREALDILRELELDASNPPSLRARSLLLTAVIHEKSGDWDECRKVIGRLRTFYPLTHASLLGSLVEVVHYYSGGKYELAARSLGRAREYYSRVMRNPTCTPSLRLMAEDMLLIGYLWLGRFHEAASVLEEDPIVTGMDPTRALIKSASIRVNVIGEKEEALSMIKKCVELYGESMYGGIAKSLLSSLEAAMQGKGSHR